jgi:hypothetical protein
MNQPTFFLSSTIYDFADLRSSVKYYLESQGSRVLASEYNDFEKPLDTHSYQACLDAIELADYYVLFIGSRVGGWYDLENKISITQQEYKTAYDLHLQGKIKIITFVRDSIWQFKESREELSKYLSIIDIEPNLRNKIENHSSKNASDAQFIINFINEVGRNEETKTALKESGDLPTANWLHIFKGFDQVVDVLRTQVFSGLPKEQSLIRDLLFAELRGLLKQSLVKVDHGKVYSPTVCIRNLHLEHEFTTDSREQDSIAINTKHWDLVATFTISLLSNKITTKILEHALLTNTFLEFSVSKGRYITTDVHDALTLLQNEIDLFNRANKTDTTQIIFQYSPVHRRGNPEFIEVETMKLWPLLHLLDRWVNIIELLKGLIVFLDGSNFEMPVLQPASPIKDILEGLERETISNEELDRYLSTA